MHADTAHSVHYYSFAQVRQKEVAYQGGKNNKWYCFNDSNVMPFDSTKLEAINFGGLFLTQNPNLHSDERDKINLAKSYSVYLLIYDREESYGFDDQVNCSPGAVPVELADKDCNHDTLCAKNPEWLEHVISKNSG